MDRLNNTDALFHVHYTDPCADAHLVDIPAGEAPEGHGEDARNSAQAEGAGICARACGQSER